MRSETVFDKSAYAGVQRAVVTVDGWYDLTGETGQKTPWRINRKDGALLWFATVFDIWNGLGGIDVAQVATVTCEPSADVRNTHNRMGVLLTEDQVEFWLRGDHNAAAALMRPFPDGMLSVKPAGDVDLS